MSSIAVNESCSQTDLARLECCDSCYSIQTVLKNVGDNLEKCLRSICAEEPNLATTRAEIREEIFWCSQSSAISRWCEALRTDTLKITQRISASVKRNQELEQELKKSKNSLNTQMRDHEVAVDKLKRKSGSLAAELTNEKKDKAELLKLKIAAEVKVKDLEQQLSLRDADIKKDELERSRLQLAASGLEKLQQELKINQAASCKNLNKIKSHLEEEKRSKNALKASFQKMEDELKRRNEEIEKQAKLLAKATDENHQLKYEITDTRLDVSDVNARFNEERDQKDLQIQRLEKELKESQAKIDLLTLYPDLNGPINPPESDNEDVLLTMENQFKANKARAQILYEQNERLSGTIIKLRRYMQRTGIQD